jgi:hypothetical protein
MRERAAARRRVANRLQGEPLGDDAVAYVARETTSPARVPGRPMRNATDARHEQLTGTHTHDHAAFGSHVHVDGMHNHEHDHYGDADHDHEHDGE